MKRRLRKKVHRRYLDYVLDASQRSHWRQRLFASAVGTVFPIDARHCESLSPRLVRALRRYGLAYTVRVIPGKQAPSWKAYVDDGLVIFRFEAREFPVVHGLSANNPDVV